MAWFRCTGGSGGSLKLRTASGAIASFETNLTALLNSLKCEITASGGNGSPDSPIPIVGHSELNLTRCGKNLFSYDDLPLYAGYFTGSDFVGTPLEEMNIETVESWRWCYYLIPVSGKSNITLSGFDTTGGTMAVWLFDLSDFSNFQNAFSSQLKNGTHTIPNNAKYLVVPMNDVRSQRTNHANAQAEYGSTATAYEPYNGQTFTVQFGQTVYGGVYDKSGRLTITWGAVDLGALEWFYNSGLQIFYTYIDLTNNVPIKANGLENVKCSIYQTTTHEYVDMLDGEMRGTDDSAGFNIKDLRYSDTATFKTAMSGIILAYELATPIVIDVPSISVFAEKGVNNIISDGGGDVSVSYLELIRGT